MFKNCVMKLAPLLKRIKNIWKFFPDKKDKRNLKNPFYQTAVQEAKPDMSKKCVRTDAYLLEGKKHFRVVYLLAEKLFSSHSR